jgi:LacI family transcriptional regulator
VSPMTVSRVINGESNVRPATRDAVNTAISALNYAPNPAARNLAGAGQTRIGLLYSNPSAGFLSEFLLGSLDQAARSDVQIIVEKCELGEHEIEVTKHLIDGGIDGIVLPPPLCEAQAVLALLAEAKIPTVVVASGFPATQQLAVRIDDREAALTISWRSAIAGSASLPATPICLRARAGSKAMATRCARSACRSTRR